MSVSIKNILTSYSKETEELTGVYSINGVIDFNKLDDLINLVKIYLDKELIKKASTIKLDNATPHTLYNIEDIKSSCQNFTSPKIEIKFHKNDNNLIVFSLNSFINKIKEHLTNKATMTETLNKFFLKNIILVENNIDNKLSYVTEENTAPEYLLEVSKIIKFSSKEELKVSPYNINLENIKNSDSEIINNFYRLANGLKNYLSLLYIASNIDIKDNNIEIIFDGNRERLFQLTGEETINNFNTLDKYKELFFWIYKKESDIKNQNFIEKLEIVRNLIAITFVKEKSLITLNNNVYDILSKSTSNYKIYLKSKTKDYFELRFKIEEHTDKLFNSLGDEFTKFSDFFTNNLYIFIGLIFSSALFTLLRSQTMHLDSVPHNTHIFLNQDVSIVISLYGVFSLILLLISAIKVISNIDDLSSLFLYGHIRIVSNSFFYNYACGGIDCRFHF